MFRGLAMACIGMGLCMGAASGQEPRVLALSHAHSTVRIVPLPAFTISRDVREVEVWFTATDQQGCSVDDLSVGQVAVIDDGHPVGPLAYFSQAREFTARILMLIDGSDSMRRRFASARAAALALRASSTPDRAPDVFYFVGRNVYCEAGCAAPLRSDVRPQGETPLFDQLVALAQRMEAPAPQDVRNVVVLFSDGEDNSSRSDLEAVVQAFQQRNIAVYTITAHSRRLEFAGDRVLRRLADATGGRAFFLSRYEEAPPALAQIQAELRTQYVLAFRPPDALPWSYHRLSVVATGRPDVRVNARAGYLVQP